MNLVEEIEKSIAKAKDKHGDKYTYQAIGGTKVLLSGLKPNQYVCQGGKWWHLLMTEK